MQDVEKQLQDMLKAYYDALDKGVEQALNSTMAQGLRMIQRTGGYNDLSGRYRRGFRVDLKKLRAGSRVGTLYNTRWALTHLLESGHEIRRTRNGPSYGRSAAFPHWDQTEQSMLAMYDRLIEDAVRNARG